MTDWLPQALDLIKQFEGCRLHAYPDPATGNDPWTVGVGHTGPEVVEGTVWTQAQADHALAKDVGRFAVQVDGLTKGVATSPAQKAALVSLAFNIGAANLAASTLLKLHRSGDYEGATRQFQRWNRAAGKVMAGLTRRRLAEAAVYAGQSK